MKTRFDDGVVAIRPFKVRDFGFWWDSVCESFEEFSLWIPGIREGYTKKQARGYVQSLVSDWESGGGGYAFVVTVLSSRERVGGVGVRVPPSCHKYGILWYWTRQGSAGQGYATRAARLIAEFALKELKLNRLEILIASDNLPSLRIPEKIGAQREGTLRNRLMINGRLYDATLYSMIASDLGA